ncbi:MAG: hypothetical protein CM15mV11_2180 [Caudoviricetes sp.]|nr:MAG: hypothetical protein CM15mV11_2180 [Caudoviricetes sp.]
MDTTYIFVVNNIAVCLVLLTTAYAMDKEPVIWVQVPQWSDDWEKCAVDVPEQLSWYVAEAEIHLEKDLTGRMLRGIVQKD